MPTVLIRIAALAVLSLPLAGCLSYTETPKPGPVVVQQPPTGSVVVQPQP